MLRRIAFSVLWLGFLGYAFLLAPPDQPGNFELIKNLFAAEWQGINPAIIALFNIMGIWPFIYCGVIFADGRNQKTPAWLFAIVSFFLGSIALLPYIILREPNQKFSGEKNLLIRFFDARLLGIVLTITSLMLVIYSFIKGDWSNFFYQWQTNRLIHVTFLDFWLLHFLFPVFLGDDMARRNWQNQTLYWVFAIIPLFGPLLYLCLRPPLPEEDKTEKEVTLKTEVSPN